MAKGRLYKPRAFALGLLCHMKNIQIFLPSNNHCIPIFCAVAQIFGTKIRNTAENQLLKHQ